jgi:hypothetical protein
MSGLKNQRQNAAHAPGALLPTVLIVVVNWNGKAELLPCLDSIGKLDYPGERRLVLVIDNGSTDGSPETVAATYPWAELRRNDRNLGYAKAINQGIEEGLARNVDYVWALNNDVVLAPCSLRTLVEVGETDRAIGVIGPTIYSAARPERIDHAGYSICLWTGRLRKRRPGRDVFVSPADRVAEVDSVLGCANLIKTEAFRRAGNVRTIYRAYFEETDFNVRVRRADLRVVVARDAQVWHTGSATMNRHLLRRAGLLLRNLFIFEWLNAGWSRLLVFVPYYFLIHVPYFFLRGSAYAIAVRWAQRRKRRANVSQR